MIQLYFTEFSAQAFDSNSQALSSGRMDQVCQRKPDCFTSEFVKQTKVFLTFLFSFSVEFVNN